MEWSWVAISTVVPVRLIRSSSSMMSWLVSGSRLPVGSSASSRNGRFDERARDRHALLLAAGELVGHAFGLAVEADEVEHLGHHLADRVRGLADHLEGEGDVLAHRLVGQQPEVLEHAADALPQPGHAAARQLGHVEVVHGDRAPGGHVLAQQEPQERGLARSGGADQEDELAPLDVRRDPVERGARGGLVHLGDAVEADHGGAGYRRPRPNCDPGRGVSLDVRFSPGCAASGCRPR